MKKYYVVYASKDLNRGYYCADTVSWVICVTESLEVAQDLCKKFYYDYSTETVGEDRNTSDDVRSVEPKEII